MQLSRFTDYSLRVLIYIGLRQDRLVTISEIAQNYCISQNHLVKVVHQLGIHGYIKTIRGKGGGIRLARRPELINIGNVVRDTEENMDIAECFDPNKQSCSLLPTCILKSALIEARQSFLATLDFYRLSDFLVNQSALPVIVTLQKMPGKTRVKNVA